MAEPYGAERELASAPTRAGTSVISARAVGHYPAVLGSTAAALCPLQALGFHLARPAQASIRDLLTNPLGSPNLKTPHRLASSSGSSAGPWSVTLVARCLPGGVLTPRAGSTLTAWALSLFGRKQNRGWPIVAFFHWNIHACRQWFAEKGASEGRCPSNARVYFILLPWNAAAVSAHLAADSCSFYSTVAVRSQDIKARSRIPAMTPQR